MNFDFDFGMNKRNNQITAAVFAVLGLIFILFSKHIGYVIIRIVMLAGIIGIGFYIKDNFKELSTSRKVYVLATEAVLVVSLLYPGILMMAAGIELLCYSLYKLYNIVVKNGSNLDVPMLVINILLILLARTMIMNSGAAIAVVVKFLGGIMLAIAVALFYSTYSVS